MDKYRRGVKTEIVEIKFYFPHLGICRLKTQEILGTGPRITLIRNFIFFVVLGLVPRTSWISDWYIEPTPQYKID